MNRTKITDVVFTDQFWEDYERAPEQIKRRMGKRIVNITANHGPLPGDKPHKVGSYSTLWIAYVSQSGSAWRYLFEYVDSVMIVHRLLDHDTTEKYLRSLRKSET